MKILELLKDLTKENIWASVHYNEDSDEFFIDLNTHAKSHLHLYENGVLVKRYDRTEIVFDELILRKLCVEFKDSLCGRDYGNQDWFKLCEKLGI